MQGTKTPKIISMIPARIGSTRFKKKNLAMLNGKPMISYAIEAAIKSKKFEKIVVNTDDNIFKKIAYMYDGVDFYLRPKYLGGSEIKSDDVVIDFIKNYPCDIVVWQNPIAPLQEINDIQICVDYFLSEDLDALYTTKKEQVQTIFKNKPVNFSTLEKFEQTQNLEPVYPFGPFLMIWNTKSFISSYNNYGQGFFCGKIGYLPVSKNSSVIIKYEEDFRFAETILKSYKNKKNNIQYYS